MNNPVRRQTRRARILEISQEIEDLSTELNLLIIQEDQDANNELRTTEPDPQDDFVIGNRVEITNSYKGQRGLQGIVTKVTAKQVSIRIDGQRRTISKKKTNVRLVE